MQQERDQLRRRDTIYKWKSERGANGGRRPPPRHERGHALGMVRVQHQIEWCVREVKRNGKQAGGKRWEDQERGDRGRNGNEDGDDG